MHPAPHLRQQAAERRTRAVTQRRGVLPPQRGVDVRRGHQACAFLARLGKAETSAYQFFGRGDTVERRCVVVCLF